MRRLEKKILKVFPISKALTDSNALSETALGFHAGCCSQGQGAQVAWRNRHTSTLLCFVVWSDQGEAVSNRVGCDIHRKEEKDYCLWVKAYITYLQVFLPATMCSEKQIRSQKVERTRDYWCILASVLTVAGTPSSWRAPWFDTRIPFTPIFTASLASSAGKQTHTICPSVTGSIDTMMRESLAPLKNTLPGNAKPL